MSFSVSVIMPCYNAAAYLREALDSALHQTHPPLEIIVVDDGSSDGSAAIAESYGPPVSVICQENQGPSVARNRALEAARGDWFAFLDSDDLWLPTKLEKQLAVVGPDIVCVHTNWRLFGARDFVYDVSTIPEDRRYTVEQLCISTNPFHLSSVIIRGDLPVRFRPWAVPSEDVNLYLELIPLGRMVLVPEVLTEKRVHSEALTATAAVYAKFHRSRDRWLRENEECLGAERLRFLQERILLRLVDVAWGTYWKRDWESFDALRDYLKQYAGHPKVGELLQKRRFPRWVYAVRDRLDRMRGSPADPGQDLDGGLPYWDPSDDDA